MVFIRNVSSHMITIRGIGCILPGHHHFFSEYDSNFVDAAEVQRLYEAGLIKREEGDDWIPHWSHPFPEELTPDQQVAVDCLLQLSPDDIHGVLAGLYRGEPDLFRTLAVTFERGAEDRLWEQETMKRAKFLRFHSSIDLEDDNRLHIIEKTDVKSFKLWCEEKPRANSFPSWGEFHEVPPHDTRGRFCLRCEDAILRATK